jgi:carbon storage regulator
MLVLSRKKGERIEIGYGITLTVLRITPKSIRLGIEADKHIPVIRGELAQTVSPPPGTGDGRRRQDRVSPPGNAAGHSGSGRDLPAEEPASSMRLVESLRAQSQQTKGPLVRVNGQRKRADR